MSSAQRPRTRGARLHILVPALAGSLLAYSAAIAQSTGSQTVEEVVVTAKKQVSISGVVTLQEAPKSKSVITQDYIATQPPGQNVIQDLNFAPGVNYTNDDPFGMSGSGGHLRIRGFDGAHISLLVDGVPLNDTGNYAIYPGELVDPEIIGSTNVNIGSTDVDSPTASAVGGLININTLKPTQDFGGFIQPSAGYFGYRRIAGLINTGVMGPLGTTAWFEASDQEYDKFKGYGTFKKWQINGKIYQDLHHEGDFVAVAFLYDSQRQPNIYDLDLPTFGPKPAAGDAWNTDYLPFYVGASPTPGKAGNDNTASTRCNGVAGIPANLTCTGNNFYGNQVNPTDTYNVRGESLFHILPNLQLTVDPAFQSVLADGGGQARVFAENDPRLIGTATTFPGCPAGQKGVDLNGDGDCLDQVRVFAPSLTHTERITVNTSLIWNINDDNLIRLAYAYDHGHHRQIGGANYLNADGTPENVFGEFGGGTPVLAADGSLLRYRDRLSIAVLNQYSAEYVGKFFNERLRVDLGIRDPHFSRNLNNFCWTSSTNGSTAYCDTATPPASAASAIPPFKESVHYTKALPNVGLSWKFDSANMVYFSYSEEFSAPKTDDLYTVPVPGASGVNLDNVKPETTTNYELGYRYQTSRVLGSVALWDAEYQNRIVSTYDPVTNLTDDRNVGSVRLYGVDAQIGAKPIDHLTVLANLSYEKSRVRDNLTLQGGLVEPLQGKELVETPDLMAGGRVTYEMGDFVFGLQGKYVSKRWITDLNDLSVAGYTTWDIDARWKLDKIWKGSYLQLNVQNLFNARYYGSLVGTQPTANSAYNGTNGLPKIYAQPYAAQGAPRTLWVTYRQAF